jgi:hydrogenase maturation protein HypF
MARKQGLVGRVDNRTDGVSVIIQGDLKTINSFSDSILQNAPPVSVIKSIEINPTLVPDFGSFEITESKSSDNQITEISPDIAVCQDCLDDMIKDPARIDYPLINCTNCGPRFTIIEGLPYDRERTTMKGFSMCGRCGSEYNDTRDRRFHAQPVACNTCGPVYRFRRGSTDTANIKDITRLVSAEIESGRSVAIKGLGGYQLICDALNNDAVSELRRNKHRDLKPFAVMFSDIGAVKKYCFVNKSEEKELLSWRRPVVILKQKEILSAAVSNGLDTTGAILPYMPFHYLLFRDLKTPAIVFTSGNITDEPIITDDSIAEEKLSVAASSLVSCNRPIYNRVDDSVIRFAGNRRRILRRSRGFVPGPIELEYDVEGILALGAEQKNTICLGKGHQAIMSQYIGDIKNYGSYRFFLESIERMSDLFRFKTGVIACDLHPGYLSAQHAESLGKEINKQVVKVQHHHAHIASCMAEYGLDEPVIGISLDGTGYGTDDNIWGGEFMVAGLDGFERVSHFDYVAMPGGEKAVAEPWRMAYSYIYSIRGDDFDYESLPVFRSVGSARLSLVKEMIINKINSPLTSGAGRLFDAAAAIMGLCTVATFDSEAPMRLESLAEYPTEETYPFSAEKTIKFSDTIMAILYDLPGQKLSFISTKLHNTILRVILEISEKIRNDTSLKKVVLSGGVFQNKYLLERSVRLLNRNRFRVFTNQLIPANDGGISLGQLIIASKTRR